jgi:hypothetical protein
MKNRVASIVVGFLLLAFLLGSLAGPAQAAAMARGAKGLSQAEKDGLLFMREEEKLARDVYLVLYGKWQQTTFSNIASSEENHMAAVKNLLDYYGLPDPAAGNGIGEFVNQDLQALYTALIVQGTQSLPEALLAGGAIEEIDILDLEDYLVTAKHNNIITVYNRLLDGSCNHLRAFVSVYEAKTGTDYLPQYLSPGVFAAIMAGTY